MSKQIIEQIKKLSQKERIELFKELSDLNARDTNYASQGIDPGTGYWDDHLNEKHSEKKEVKDDQAKTDTSASTTSEKEKTGEILPGPITEEDKKTGEADKIKKEDND